MYNFFTPTQVIHKHKILYTIQEFSRFPNHHLFQMTNPRVPSLADQRRQVISWLRSLSPQARQQAVTLKSPELAFLVRKLYQQSCILNKNLKYSFIKVDGKFQVIKKQTNKINHNENFERSLLFEVRLITQGRLFQQLTLSEQYLTDPELLLVNLEKIVGPIYFGINDFTKDQLKSQKVHFDQVINDTQQKSIGLWVAQLFLKQIMLSFTTKGQKIDLICKHLREQQQEYSKLWREVTPQVKKIIVQKSFLKPFQQIIQQYAISVAVDSRQFPTLYLSNRQQIIRQYISLQSKDIFYRIIFSTLETSFEQYEMYKVELTLQIQTYLSNLKNQSKKQKKKKRKNIDHIPTTQPISVQNIPKIVKQTINTGNYKESDKTTTESQITQSKLTIEQKHQQFINFQQKPIVNIFPDQQIQAHQKQQNISIIDGFLKRIRQKNRDKYRKIILNRLTVLLGNYNLVCKPFGSYAVHLCLPDSDLDVQVDSSLLSYFYLDYLSQKKQIVAALQFLKKVFQSQNWVSQLSLFQNARIPILTFKADAGIHFESPSKSKNRLKVNGKSLSNGQGKIHVDLSIQPFANMNEIAHNGLQSTEQIKFWVQSLPYFQNLALPLKVIIKKANLHKSYEGGINSYCLLLFLAAFLKYQKPQKIQTDELFERLVKFITQCYQSHLIIDITSEDIVLQGSTSAVLVSPWDKRNLIERCFRLPQIITALSKWRLILEQ